MPTDLNPSSELSLDPLDSFLVEVENRLKSHPPSPQAIIQQYAEIHLVAGDLNYLLGFIQSLESWTFQSDDIPTELYRHPSGNIQPLKTKNPGEQSGTINLALEVAMIQLGDTSRKLLQGRYKLGETGSVYSGSTREERWKFRLKWLGALRRVYEESEGELSLPPLEESSLPQPLLAACLELGEGLMRMGIYPTAGWTCNDVEIPALVNLSKLLLQYQNRSGLQIGRFKLLTRVGQGGYGVVYRAFDEKLRREVAIKISRSTVDGGLEGRATTIREARAAARLDHPGIVPMLDILDLPDQAVLVSAFVNGKNLAQWLKDRADMVPVGTAVHWTIAMARAMAHAHARGVLHCDLKPGNILLEIPIGNGTVEAIVPRVGDFGLSKMTTSAATLTANNQGLGTPMYMAPEQFHGRDALSTSCDIYSLGAVLYELLAKRMPYRSTTMRELLREVMEKPPVPLEESRPELHEDLKAICAKCLEKNPSDRYTTMEELARDLERYQAGEPTVARPLGRLGAFYRWYWNNLLLANSMALVLISLVASTVVFMLLYGEVTIQATNYRLQKDRADTLGKLSQRERKLSDRRYYASEMRGVQTAYEEGQVAIARDRLKELIPEKLGWEDYRGFEWHYWKRQSSLPHKLLANYGDFGMSMELGANQTVLWLKDSGVLVLQSGDGTEKARFPKGTNPCLDRQGKLLAFLDGKDLVRVLDANTLSEKTSFQGLPQIRNLFFPNKEKLVVVGLHGWQVHDSANGALLNSHSLDEKISYLQGCMIDPDHIALSTNKANIQIWNIQKNLLEEEFPCEGKIVQTMRASPAGDRLSWTVYPPRIFNRDIQGKRNLWARDARDNFMYAMVWSPDGKRLACGGSNQRIRIFDSLTGEELSQITTQNLRITKSLFWNAEGKLGSLANQFSPAKTELIAWDDSIQKDSSTLFHAKTTTLNFSLDQPGNTALIATEQATALLVSIPQGKLLHSHTFKSPVLGQTFHPLTGKFLVLLQNGELWGLDGKGKANLVFFRREMPGVITGKILASPSGREIALGVGQGGVEIFRLEDGTLLGKYQGDATFHTILAPAPDMDRLIVGQKSGPLVLISWSDASRIATLIREPSELTVASVSPTGNQLAGIMGLTNVKMFSLPDLQSTPDFRRFQTNFCNSMLWTRDSTRLVGYDTNGFIRFWDSITGQELLQLRAHDKAVVNVLEIPGRKQFLSLGKGGDLKLWDGEPHE